MSDVTVTLDPDDEVGWARFGLIADLRTLRDAGHVRWHDGHLEMKPDLLDIVRRALAGDIATPTIPKDTPCP